ncbi:hypothetical protein [Paracoccus methylarcula]|nr:hypothetical protein [Paracoccus methylarcula]
MGEALDGSRACGFVTLMLGVSWILWTNCYVMDLAMLPVIHDQSGNTTRKRDCALANIAEKLISISSRHERKSAVSLFRIACGRGTDQLRPEEVNIHANFS